MNTELSYKKIVCPIDFSDCSRKAFYVALRYAQLFDADCVLLHVREQPITVDGLEHNETEVVKLEAGVRRRLDEMMQAGDITADQRKRLDLEIRGGKPWVEIIGYADEIGSDLIIMGTHGASGFLRSVIIGSQAEKVVRRANCHVLVVKPDGFDSSLEGLPQRFKV